MNTLNKNNIFMQQAKIELPIVCGAMYPCSNPELVAAVSEAGGLGIIQPVSLTYVHGHNFRKGIHLMRKLTAKALGMNVLIERSSRKYHEKMVEWVDIALEENIRFFVTSLGKPDWVTDRVHAAGGVVYHDVTEKKWALKALEYNVDGFIAVNNRAGGHAGQLNAQQLYEQLAEFNLPILCAGGISTGDEIKNALDSGYDGVQLGTRFIATTECNATIAYKNAIVAAKESDIVLSERITGVPVSVINTPYVRRSGTKAGWFSRWMLRGNKTKHWMRTIYGLKSLWQFKKSNLDTSGKFDYWQAGKSVQGITEISSVNKIMTEYKNQLFSG